MTGLRVCYKHGVRFDEGYFVSKHLPIAAGILGPYGMKRVKRVRGGEGGEGGKPPYQVIFSGYFESAAGLQNAMQGPRMGEVIGDIRNYYDGMPDIMIGEVVALPAQG